MREEALGSNLSSTAHTSTCLKELICHSTLDFRNFELHGTLHALSSIVLSLLQS